MLRSNFYRLFPLFALFCASSSKVLRCSLDESSFLNASIMYGVVCRKGVLICPHSDCFINSNKGTKKKAEIEEDTELLVSGYVKKIEIPEFNNKKQIIPLAIIELCIKFYTRSVPCHPIIPAFFCILQKFTCTCKESASQNQCNYCKNSIIFKNCINLYKIENKADRWFQFGWKPLHYTCKNNDKENTKLLLKRGADINAQTGKKNMTALHCACKSGHIEIVKLLIENKADIHLKDCKGQTALYHACNNEHIKMAELLLKNEAKIDEKDAQKCTIFELACKKGKIKTVTWLLDDCHLSIETTGGVSKGTPFIWAAMYGQVEVLKFLKKRGANIHAKDGYGSTALAYAMDYGYKKAENYLKNI